MILNKQTLQSFDKFMTSPLKKGINLKTKLGFTLVEIIVVVTILAVIMVSIVSVVISVLKVQNQTKSNTKVVSGGGMILNELKKNMLNSSKSTIVCSEDGTSISFANNFDGQTTIISCSNGKIASTSAQTVYLNSGDVSVTDCSQFVTCNTQSSLEISSVKFKFGIGSSVSGISANQNFEMEVAVRN